VTKDICITFPGGKRVDADFGTHVVRTDQSPEHGGRGSAPEPFDLFLASLAACAGAYVLGFCQARNIATDRIVLLQQHRFREPEDRLEHVELQLMLPDDFPEKYRAAVVRAAAHCKVKKLLAAPPEIVVTARNEAGELLATGSGQAALQVEL
jgi:ribosomal protein S12 methylthiotransferase accessory factor